MKPRLVDHWRIYTKFWCVPHQRWEEGEAWATKGQVSIITVENSVAQVPYVAYAEEANKRSSSMAEITLSKGESIDLSKAAPSETKFVAGAGWDPKEEGKAVDLDLMAILIGADGKAIPDANGNGTNLDEAVVFYNNKTLPGFQLSEDDLTGQSSDGGDDETLQIDTTAVQAIVTKVILAVGSYSGQNFSAVENAYGRLVDSKDTELGKVNLGDQGSVKAVVFAELERVGTDWKFTNTTQSFNDIEAMLDSYGVKRP